MINELFLSETQMALRPGLLDLGLGHPDPGLLPAEELRESADRVFARFGVHALNYGWAAGPGPLLDWLCARAAKQEGRDIRPDQIALSAGISQALDTLLKLNTAPGDGALVESPVYHLAVRVLRDHPLRIEAVASDDDGLDPEQFGDAIRRLRASGVRPRVLYCVPTHNNPSGRSWSMARRQAIVEIAARESVLILEDDAYRELTYDHVVQPSLWSMAPAGVVARMGSFSKSLAPGLRVGWITASAAIIQGITSSGLFDSGGGIVQFPATMIAAYVDDYDFGAHVTRLCVAYRQRRDALLGALAQEAPGCKMKTPAGGFFVWVRIPDAIDQDVLLARAEASGVSFLRGTRFFAGDSMPGRNHIRLCFAMLGPEQLREGARRLAIALRAATGSK